MRRARDHRHKPSRRIAWTFQPGVTEPPKTTSPLAFDQRHKISASIDYRFVDKDGPRFLGGQPLSNAGINVLFTAGSGFPYTPTFTFNEVTTGGFGVTSFGSGEFQLWSLDLQDRCEGE